ncbi:beta strand repeat-containing protein [Salinibacterium hongtaonis]|uniref:Cadherin-like beta-sandwich-like domain-containing protein n=1 Tax=Homoserinimonas hongtaonis TaxID=2079791 RepID=A0A2U1SZV4_9MICO|nr:cadherin-like beta sandwich domain-containing protein [Salinibacterium hongtaonis]PWB97136.1 hypothetical protein DF220_04255 [Salinibacterium hongtaonis]
MSRTLLRRCAALATALLLAAGMAFASPVSPAAQADPIDCMSVMMRCGGGGGSGSPGYATLSGLSLSEGTLSPGFSVGSSSYTASVGNATASITVTPTAADPVALITVNGVPTASGTASSVIPLNVGTTIVYVQARYDGGGSSAYTVAITRAPSSNANLSALSLSSGTLAPAFDSATTGYTASVTNATTSLTVTPTVADATASVTVNGVTAAGGSASGAIALNVGSNTMTVIVTAQSGATKTYTVTVTREASANANLSALSLSSGALAPAFAAATSSYTASVVHATTSLTVTPTLVDANASVTVNGVAVTSGSASGAITLNVGSNTLTVEVTAQNGATKTYTVTVTRAASSNNDLSGLSLSSGTLSPAFASATTGYTASVDNTTTALTVTPTVADANASVTVNGVAVTSGNASGAIALGVGSNTVTVVVTAQDGSTKTYTVTITRAAPDLTLDSLTLSHGTLSPSFSASTTAYTADVGYDILSIDVGATTGNAAAVLAINGKAAKPATISLAVGENTIEVVTAKDGITRTTTITVTRAGPSTNASLGAITVSGGSLSPAFDAARTSYTATVGYLTTEFTVGATAADAAATLLINGNRVTSAVVPLTVGANTVTIVATAQDGTTSRTTTIVITRSEAALPSATIEVEFAQGDSVAGSTSHVSASNLLPGSVATLTMRSAPVVLATGTVLADGTIVLDATLPAGTEPGAHRLIFDGVAQDGSAVTRTVWFTVLRNGTIGAVSLTGPVAYVEPAATAVTKLPATGADAAASVLLGAAASILGLLLLMLGSRRRVRI